MTIIAFNRYWVIRWPWMLVNVLVFALLLGLSYWQWLRAEEKMNTLARIEHWKNQGALNSNQLSSINHLERDGLQLDFQGRWLSPGVWLIDNKMVNGRIGYDVLIAVQDISAPADAAALLVNLGWIAAPQQRDTLPEVRVPNELHIRGIFRTRIKGVLLGTNIENKGVWPMRIQQVDSESLAAYLSRPLVDGLIYQEKNSPFLVHYQSVVLPPERHRAYALQWFLLAVAVVVVAIAAGARKNPQPYNNHKEQSND